MKPGRWGWKRCFQCAETIGSVFLIVFLVLDRMPLQAQDIQVKIRWEQLPPLPPATGKIVQPGLAGPVTGAHGNFVMVAGGANFEDAPPWKGGTKKYHDIVYLLKKRGIGNYSWSQSEFRLPAPLAYSACVSTPSGVVSAGGENERGQVSSVYMFSFKKGAVRMIELASLPFSLTASGAATVGNYVYVAGGLSGTAASPAFLRLNSREGGTVLEKLPDLPVPISHAVVVSQYDGTEQCIYVLGGRNKTGEVSEFFATVWKYSPSQETWTLDSQIKSGGEETVLSAGTGIPAGKNQIILFGGDANLFFNRTEKLVNAIEKTPDEMTKTRLIQEKNSILDNHPGFTKSVLIYNTLSKEWVTAAEYEGYLPVTTTSFYWGSHIVTPTGEIRPGIRTPEILMFKMNL